MLEILNVDKVSKRRTARRKIEVNEVRLNPVLGMYVEEIRSILLPDDAEKVSALVAVSEFTSADKDDVTLRRVTSILGETVFRTLPLRWRLVSECPAFLCKPKKITSNKHAVDIAKMLRTAVLDTNALFPCKTQERKEVLKRLSDDVRSIERTLYCFATRRRYSSLYKSLNRVTRSCGHSAVRSAQAGVSCVEISSICVNILQNALHV